MYVVIRADEVGEVVGYLVPDTGAELGAVVGREVGLFTGLPVYCGHVERVAVLVEYSWQ